MSGAYCIRWKRECRISFSPHDASGNNHAARLTIDVGAGDRWLIALNRHAAQYWLRPDAPVLDYANAMVGAHPLASRSMRRPCRR